MKVTFPPHIISIHGHIGNVIYYNAYGIQYARSYAKPRNPRTAEQQKIRTTFGEVSKLWKQLTDEEKSLYNRMAEGKPLNGYNVFMSMTLKGIKPESVSAVQYKQVTDSLLSDSYQILPNSVPPGQGMVPAANRHQSNLIILKMPPGGAAIAA